MTALHSLLSELHKGDLSRRRFKNNTISSTFHIPTLRFMGNESLGFKAPNVLTHTSPEWKGW